MSSKKPTEVSVPNSVQLQTISPFKYGGEKSGSSGNLYNSANQNNIVASMKLLNQQKQMNWKKITDKKMQESIQGGENIERTSHFMTYKDNMPADEVYFKSYNQHGLYKVIQCGSSPQRKNTPQYASYSQSNFPTLNNVKGSKNNSNATTTNNKSHLNLY